MPYDYGSIMQAQAQRIEADQAQAVADLEAARRNEDADGTMYAAGRILELDAQRAALDQRASQYLASQQQHQRQGNKYGLSPDELEIAHGAGGDMSKEEKEELYARNRDKLRYTRATGQYRDDQGRVGR